MRGGAVRRSRFAGELAGVCVSERGKLVNPRTVGVRAQQAGGANLRIRRPSHRRLYARWSRAGGRESCTGGAIRVAGLDLRRIDGEDRARNSVLPGVLDKVQIGGGTQHSARRASWRRGPPEEAGLRRWGPPVGPAMAVLSTQDRDRLANCHQRRSCARLLQSSPAATGCNGPAFKRVRERHRGSRYCASSYGS